MDRSWMRCSRISKEYQAGVEGFIEFALANASDGGLIQCPCKKCVGLSWREVSLVQDHLIIHGFKANYEVRDQHGEARAPRGDMSHGMEQMLRDAFPSTSDVNDASSSMPYVFEEKNSKFDE